MNIGQIDEMVSRAIAQLERAKMRLVKSLDTFYPRMVGPKERAEIRETNLELAMAHSEIGMAEHLTMEVIQKLGDFTRANEEAEAQRQMSAAQSRGIPEG